MKQFTGILLVFCFFTIGLHAQVTSLMVNDSSSPFTTTSGDSLSWSYNLSTGGTSIGEIWVDVNTNGTIDPGADIRMFYFPITDGVSDGDNGPGDMDGQVNGAISVGPLPLGLAPAHYIMKFTENNFGQTITGTVAPLSSPLRTISGKVTPPAGSNADNIIITMERDNQIPGVFFWNAITDVNGDFTVETNADTVGPWRLKISTDQNPFPAAIITPQSYEFYITGNMTGKDFVVTNAAAKVVGLLKKEDGSPAPFASVNLGYQIINSGYFSYYADTDANGLFQFGIETSRLTGQEWTLDAYLRSSETTENYIDARITLNPINNGDSVYKVLTLYDADASITGKVSFSGNSTNIPQITIIALTDSTQSVAYNNTTDGNYTLKVSSKILANNVFGINLPTGYGQITLNDVAPGATNADLNYLLTDVKDNISNLPESFSLSQNYPNPFNPSTTISYSLPKSGHTTLKVFNILGNEVANLVNEDKAAGQYNVKFDASNLPSGIYFYKIQSGSFVETKKMILLK
jgi:hypothetical protein